MPNSSRARQTPHLVALGATIRRIRLAQGLSQEQLALQAEVDRGYLGRVERGDNNAAILTLVRIASALGLPLGQLISEAGL